MTTHTAYKAPTPIWVVTWKTSVVTPTQRRMFTSAKKAEAFTKTVKKTTAVLNRTPKILKTEKISIEQACSEFNNAFKS